MARIPKLQALTLRGRLVFGAVLGLAAALGLSTVRSTDAFESLELRFVDLRTRHFADQRTPDPRIVVMQIEESDIARVNAAHGERWPWPLELNAHLVDVLREADAAALMNDMLHLDRGAGPDDLPGAETLTDRQRAERFGEAESAKVLRSALTSFGRAAVAFELSATPQYELPTRKAAAATRLGNAALAHHQPAVARSGAEFPVRHVTEGAGLLGFVNMPSSLDGVVRRAPVLGRWGTQVVMSLPLAATQLSGVTPIAEEVGGIRVGAAFQPLAPDAAFLVNFHSSAFRGGYARIAPADVLDWKEQWDATGSLPEEARAALKDKIVVFGLNIAGIKDVVASPLRGTMDGPVFQATVLDNLLHGDGRVREGRRTNVIWLFALTLLVGLLGGALRGRLLPHLMPASIGALFTWFVFERFGMGVSLDLFTPLLGVVLTWGGSSALTALTEGRRNRWLEGTFGRYMSPSIIAALKREPALLELGGRERELSVLFSDVAGFTTMATLLEPSELALLLNRYLTAHCAAVMDNDGVVDKFEGDAVMAFYGDPVPDRRHALHACRTALRVQAELPGLRPTLEALGIESFEVRIGINTGHAVVGNMGSEQRFDYTCMGDTVNLASRLEGAAKRFGVSILIGPDTAEAAGTEVVLKPLGKAVVVGRTEPVSIFELLALRAEASADLMAHASAFERALAAAREGDLAGATASLDEAAHLRPGDGATVWFRGVLETLRGQAWDGTTVLLQK